MLSHVYGRLAGLCIAVAVVASTATFGTGCSSGSDDVEAKAQEIQRLIPVGMDIDKAIELLRDEGYRVGDKHHPTKAEDYYLALVPLRDHIPTSDTVRYTLGIEGSSKTYVVIKANVDGEITSVE